MIKIYVDGSTRGKNQRGVNNKGGYGVVVMNNDEDEILYSLSVQCNNTTNNRMELFAIYEAFNLLKEYPNEKVKIISDSAYCVNCLNEWIFTWARNGWTTSKKTEPENLDIIRELYVYVSSPFFFQKCSIEKINGHCGDIGNELADALATNNMKKYEKYIEEYDLRVHNEVVDFSKIF